MQQRIQQQLAKLKQLNLTRKINYKQQVAGSYIYIEDSKYIDFSSNDYLGLSQEKTVLQAAKEALDDFSLSATSSSWVNGLSSIHKNLNDEICRWLEAPSCALFSSGFMANLGTIESLCNREDVIFHDKDNHASLLSGVKLSRCKHYRYRHLDYNHLAQLYKQFHKKHNWIISDAVFSMSGKNANLSKIASLQDKNCGIIIDDAHGIGLFGKDGAGSFSKQGVCYLDNTVHIITFGKAIGSMGAAVIGSKETIEYIQQKANTMAYTTAMPPAIAAGTLKSIQLIRNDESYRQKLFSNIQLFNEILTTYGLIAQASESPIFKINAKSIEHSELWSRKLKAEKFWVHPVKPPSVANAGLRVIITARHTSSQLKLLGKAINATWS
jgi:8-amino-7-oxononanoate synthase